NLAAIPGGNQESAAFGIPCNTVWRVFKGIRGDRGGVTTDFINPGLPRIGDIDVPICSYSNIIKKTGLKRSEINIAKLLTCLCIKAVEAVKVSNVKGVPGNIHAPWSMKRSFRAARHKFQ